MISQQKKQPTGVILSELNDLEQQIQQGLKELEGIV